MIRHIVLMKLKPRTTEDQARQALKRIEDLKDAIPEILDVNLGSNLNALPDRNLGYTHGFTMHFATPETLKAYAEHPMHREAGRGLRAISESIIDFDLQV